MKNYVSDEGTFSLNQALGIPAYPANICKTCISEIDDLVTSGEWSAARELLEDNLDAGCSDCEGLRA